MSTIVVPASIVRHLRSALLSALGTAAALIEQASMRYEREKHPEWFTGPLGHFDAHRALLDVVGWGEPPAEQDTQVDLEAHRWAIVTAMRDRLEVEQDYLRVDASAKDAGKQRNVAQHNAEAIESFLATSGLEESK